jgi:hypothetical protein
MAEQLPLTRRREDAGTVASTTAAPAPSIALRAIMDAQRCTGLLSDEIEQLREILRAITSEAGWLDALALAADYADPMSLIWALLEEVPDQYIVNCAPLLSRLTDLSLPVEPLARLLGRLDRRTPAADVAAAAAQIAPTSSSLTQRFAMRLLARAQALVRDCWSIIIAGLDAQTPAWRLKQLAAHVPRAFVLHLAQRARALANPVETIEVLCALAPWSASPAAQIRSALSTAHNLRTLMRGAPPETIAAAQRQALACVATALDAAGMGAGNHVRLSAIRQAALIRSGYERNAALEALQAPVTMGVG